MFHRPLRYYYLRLMRQPGRPEEVAGGMALGLFLALAVPPGLGLIVLAAALFLVRRVNRFAAIIGCAVTNPLTMPVIYYWSYRVGVFITGMRPGRFPASRAEFWGLFTNYQQHARTLLVLGVGAFATAVTASLTGYFVTKWLVEAYQRARAARAARRRLDIERAEAEREALRGNFDDSLEP